MPQKLDSFLIGKDDIIALFSHLFIYCFVFHFLSIIFGLVKNSSITSSGNVLSYLDILLCSLKLFKLLFKIFNEILCKSSLTTSSMLARSSTSLCGTEIKMLHNLIFSNIVLLSVLMVFWVISVHSLDLSAQFGSSLLLGNLETSWEAASLFVEEFWSPLLIRGFNDILNIGSNLGNFTFWVKWTNS